MPLRILPEWLPRHYYIRFFSSLWTVLLFKILCNTSHQNFIEEFLRREKRKIQLYQSIKEMLTSENAGIPKFSNRTDILVRRISCSWSSKSPKYRKSILFIFSHLLANFLSSLQHTRPKEGWRETHLSCTVGSTVYSNFRRHSFKCAISSELSNPDFNWSAHLRKTWKTWQMKIESYY